MRYAIALLLAVCCAARAEPSVPFGTPCTYPASAVAAGPAGATELTFAVSGDGNLHDVKVIRPSRNASLDAAAEQCVSNWRVTGDSKWVRMVNLRFVSIFWDLDSKPPTGHLVLGRPHVCLEDYPAAEAHAGIGGTTLLGFHITAEGTTSQIQVLESSGNEDLDRAAAACVVSWRYLPALKDGVPVEVPWKAEVRWVPPPPEPPQAPPPSNAKQ